MLFSRSNAGVSADVGQGCLSVIGLFGTGRIEMAELSLM